MLDIYIDIIITVTLIKPPPATTRAASRDGRVHLFVCLSVAKLQNAIFSQTKQFRAMVSIDDVWEFVQRYSGLFKEPIIRFLKSKMAEILHLGS